MRLALGTAQFGLDYGITNSNGKVRLDTVESILSYASDVGICCLDTAMSYGDSESVLGNFDLSPFRIVTKLPKSCEVSYHKVRQCVEKSLQRLGVPKLYGLLVHDESDMLTDKTDQLFESLLRLQSEGVVEKVGGSFYSPEVAKRVLQSYPITLMQASANQLDTRFVEATELTREYEQVELHTRSLFLQGLLLAKKSERPSQFINHPDLIRYDALATRYELTNLELALMFLHQHETIHTGVVGCLSVEQLKEIVQSYQNVIEMKPIPESERCTSQDIKLINPSLWS